MRERLAYLLLIGIFIMIVTIMFAVLGKGVYQPPTVQQQEKGSISRVLI